MHSIITTRKAKGCEWNRVRITADFEAKFFQENGSFVDDVPMEKINILEVAVTRERRFISYPQKFQALFEN